MSRWVNHEYEGAIAFLFILVSSLVPWSFSTASTDIAGQVTTWYWWFGHHLSVEASGQVSGFYPIIEAIQIQQGQAVYPGYVLWGISSVVFAAAIGLAFALFVREEEVTARMPIRFVAGGLLLASGIGFVSANIWIMQNGIPGTYIPIGGAFQIVFGLFLVTNRYKSDSEFVNPNANTDANTNTDAEPAADS